jgi:hypothetical protein
MNLRETGCEHVNWIHMVENMMHGEHVDRIETGNF